MYAMSFSLGRKFNDVLSSAEDASRIWERRAPLTPEAVYDLVSSGKAQVEVASSSKRIFPDAEYSKVCNLCANSHFRTLSWLVTTQNILTCFLIGRSSNRAFTH